MRNPRHSCCGGYCIVWYYYAGQRLKTLIIRWQFNWFPLEIITIFYFSMAVNTNHHPMIHPSPTSQSNGFLNAFQTASLIGDEGGTINCWVYILSSRQPVQLRPSMRQLAHCYIRRFGCEWYQINDNSHNVFFDVSRFVMGTSIITRNSN